MNGLDYSQGIPDVAAMKQGNVAFVCRYVGWSDTSQTKILTSAEALTLSQNGIAIVSNYEWYGSRPSEGAAAADVDAARALQIHKNCGGPDTAPIYFSVDYDSPGSDVADYFRELANKIGLQRVGAYGGYRCIKYLFDNNLITWGWQTYAWSGGQWDSRAQIKQTQNSVQFGGIEVDFDTGMVDNVGQWKVGGTQVTTTPKVVLNAQGCVCETPWWYQLAENEMMTCGPTTCAMVHFSVQPGGQLTSTSETIDQETDAIIKDVFEISDPKQFGGVDSWTHDMYNILVYLRDKYHKIHFLEVSTMEDLERGVRAGYPCIFGCNEADITAWNKGNNQWVHAYTWNLSAGHIPGVLVGIEAGTGNWLVVDPLNNRFQGYGPPYIYKRSDIAKSFTGGAIIQLTDWLQPIPPLNQWPAGFNAQNLTGGNMGVPTGWKPGPNNTIVAPNNVPVATGFMAQVEKGWDANNYPIKAEFTRSPVEQANTALGPGTWQNFRFGALAYTQQRGVYVPWVGQELQWYMDNYDSVQKERDALKKQVSDLQAQLAASSGGTGIPQVVKDDIISLASHVTPAASMLDKLVKDAGL